MKFIKASVLVLALGCAFLTGVWTGPYLTESASTALTETMTPISQIDQPSATEKAPPRTKRVARAVAQPVSEPDAPAGASPFEPVRTASDPSVQKVAKSALNRGTNVELAAEGFNDATLFVSTAYAAQNTGIPFVLLKHRMLSEGKTLSEAIRMSKPELDAMVEMERARSRAREVVQRLAS